MEKFCIYSGVLNMVFVLFIILRFLLVWMLVWILNVVEMIIFKVNKLNSLFMLIFLFVSDMNEKVIVFFFYLY